MNKDFRFGRTSYICPTLAVIFFNVLLKDNSEIMYFILILGFFIFIAQFIIIGLMGKYLDNNNIDRTGFHWITTINLYIKSCVDYKKRPVLFYIFIVYIFIIVGLFVIFGINFNKPL